MTGVRGVRHPALGLVVAAALAGAGPLLAAAPADAWLRDVSVAALGSPSNSSSPRLLTITCPAGKVSLGAAAFTGPSLDNVALNRAAPPPNQGGTTAWVGAVETDSVSGSWSLGGRAYCASSVAIAPPVGGAKSYVKAVSIARGQSASSSATVRTAVATCPAGKTAIAGGGRIEGPFANLALTGSQRVGGDRAWRATAREVDATSADWRLHATAVCANIETETATNDYAGPGFTPKDIVFPLGSGTLQSVTPNCPPGTFVVGGGAAVLRGSGTNPPNDVALVASEPTPGDPSSGWLAVAQETDPTSAEWQVAARVLCAPLTGGPPA